MPELPDVALYVEHMQRRLRGHRLVRVAIFSPNLLRSVEPPVEAGCSKAVTGVFRLGKRIVMSFEGDLFYAIHLMIAGRIKWLPAAAKAPKRPGGRIGLATFEFESGMLVLTEAGTRKRASLEVLRGRDAVRALDRGGIEPLESTVQQFAERFRGERHTLKRSLTDPRLFSGIGNAYSDEILHRARLSPLRQTHQITDAEVKRLHRRYADNETNYCAKCQTGGRLLADRGMSRLLRGDRPKTLEELEGA